LVSPAAGLARASELLPAGESLAQAWGPRPLEAPPRRHSASRVSARGHPLRRALEHRASGRLVLAGSRKARPPPRLGGYQPADSGSRPSAGRKARLRALRPAGTLLSFVGEGVWRVTLRVLFPGTCRLPWAMSACPAGGCVLRHAPGSRLPGLFAQACRALGGLSALTRRPQSSNQRLLLQVISQLAGFNL